eukprot:6397948-Prymnesium_polylepis.1
MIPCEPVRSNGGWARPLGLGARPMTMELVLSGRRRAPPKVDAREVYTKVPPPRHDAASVSAKSRASATRTGALVASKSWQLVATP